MKPFVYQFCLTVAVVVFLTGCRRGRTPTTGQKDISDTNQITQSGDTGMVESLRPKVAGIMRRHLDKVKNEVSQDPGYAVTAPRWEKLFADEVISFAVGTAVDGRYGPSRGKQHTESRKFPGIYIVVTTLPSTNDRDCMGSFVGGYFSLLDRLLVESGYIQGDFDFAHWIYCYDSEQHKIHLTFIPSRVLATSRENIVLFARDLMTADEKSRAGIK